MTTTNDGRQQQTTNVAAQPNMPANKFVGSVTVLGSSHDRNDEQTHDTYSRLGATTLDSPASQEVSSHHSGVITHTAPNSPEHCIDIQLDHGSSYQTESPGPESTSTYHSLGQYAAQPQTLENYTLEVWWAQSRKDGSIPFPVEPKFSGASDCWDCHVPDGNKYDCGSDTGATWGGSVTQDRH